MNQKGSLGYVSSSTTRLIPFFSFPFSLFLLFLLSPFLSPLSPYLFPPPSSSPGLPRFATGPLPSPSSSLALGLLGAVLVVIPTLPIRRSRTRPILSVPVGVLKTTSSATRSFSEFFLMPHDATRRNMTRWNGLWTLDPVPKKYRLAERSALPRTISFCTISSFCGISSYRSISENSCTEKGKRCVYPETGSTGSRSSRRGARRGAREDRSRKRCTLKR